jgi:hypothetical protein
MPVARKVWHPIFVLMPAAVARRRSIVFLPERAAAGRLKPVKLLEEVKCDFSVRRVSDGRAVLQREDLRRMMANAGLLLDQQRDITGIEHGNEIDACLRPLFAEFQYSAVCAAAQLANFTVLENDRELLREELAAFFGCRDFDEIGPWLRGSGEPTK